MHVITKSCVLFLWIQTLTLVKSQARQCQVIHVDDNVLVTGDPEEATYGNVLGFRCKSNTHVLMGSPEIYCDENGEWSSKEPTCEEIKCSVPVIDNGRITGDLRDYNENEVLHFVCHTNYQKQSEILSKCIKLGNSAAFSPAPVCEPTKCKLPTHLRGSSYDPEYTTVFSPGERVTVNCGDKYYITTPLITSATSTCMDDGNWDITPLCQEVRCRSEKGLNVNYWGVRWNHILRLDDTVSYNCQIGYRAKSNQATCTRDGWTPEPLCEARPCTKKMVLNANIVSNDKESYIYDERVRYVCKDGYEGEFTLTCMGNRWYGNAQCTVKRCQQMDIPGAYIIQNNRRIYDHDQQVIYRCQEDPYQQITVTCQKGEWTGVQSCQGCPKIEIANGFVVAEEDDKAYYTCYDGYKLFTNGWWGEAICISKRWTGLEDCIENSQCGEPPVIPNGRVTPQGTRTRQTLWLDCDNGFDAQVQRLTCEGGNWYFGGLSPETLCIHSIKPCNPPPRVANAVIMASFQKQYLSGSEVVYVCREEYRAEGDDRIQCIDGQWEQKNFICTPSASPQALTPSTALPPVPDPKVLPAVPDPTMEQD
ncbi:complement factor H-like [Notolabrus celidotus]|uniref:complement factor H-like n=1 Tax=Notolabrus celidotus TaxID=1203425 RepID=UPI0014908739|nr:complement factor H-like [Notolabrus celidotus]